MRLCSDGAEFGDLLFWNNPPTNTTVSSAQVRSGTYSYSNDGANATIKNLPYAVSEGFLRIPFYQASGSGQFEVRLMKGTTIIGQVKRNNSSGQMEVYVGSTLVATSVGTFDKLKWHFLEWHLKVNDTTGISEIKIDGLMDPVSFTGDTKPTGDADFDNFLWIGGNGGNPNYVDDIGFNDTSNTDGKNDTSWCGDGHIELLKPNGNGYISQWIGSDGNSVDNYLLVDEVPPASGDYVEDYTAANKDSYEIQDYDATSKTILRVWVEARAIDTIPEGAQIKLGVRPVSTNYMSSAISLSSNYQRVVGDELKNNPEDSQPWEDADVDGLEILVETV